MPHDTDGTRGYLYKKWIADEAIVVSSDSTYKENVSPLWSYGDNKYDDFFNMLSPMTYTLKGDTEKNVRIGFIA